MLEINISERLSKLELNLGKCLVNKIKEGVNNLDKYVWRGAVIGGISGMIGFGYLFNIYEPLQDVLPYPTLWGISFGICFCNPGAYNGYAYGILKIRKLKKVHPELVNDIEEYLKLNINLKNKNT